MAAVAKKCYYSNTSKIILFDFYSRLSDTEDDLSPSPILDLALGEERPPAREGIEYNAPLALTGKLSGGFSLKTVKTH